MKGARPLSTAEVDDVCRLFEGRYRKRNLALFILGLKSGFRISELLSLRIGDVYGHGRMVDQVTVRRANMKKKIEGRTIVLHPSAKEAVEAWIAESGFPSPETFLFRSRKGENSPLTRQQAWSILDGAFNRAELQGQLGCHSMRKTFCARVHEALGRDLLKTQRALGHKCVSSTAAYLSFNEAEISEAVLSI
ncbi:MAG: tyrosine-type recombinase/integrase [Deltaproteobacteria bacterium]|nr:tyrosine-type recombinase/integrase [Deltaproteobacteria bacterium]